MRLNDIPAPALRVMARHLLGEARKMLTQAAYLEKRDSRARDFQKSQERVKRGSSAIAAQVRAGGDLEALCALYARAHQLPLESVRVHVRDAEKRHQEAGRARRDREVMRLAALGYTNAEIGKRTGLSARQVQRIVSKAISHLKHERPPV